eukprot:2342877-Pyramimonas_sp.AAC.1
MQAAHHLAVRVLAALQATLGRVFEARWSRASLSCCASLPKQRLTEHREHHPCTPAQYTCHRRKRSRRI